MNITPGRIIEHLRVYAPVFGTRVHGAAEWAQLEDQEITDLAVPAAYVLPLQDTAQLDQPAGSIARGAYSSNAPEVIITESYGIAVVVDNTVKTTGDRMGIVAANSVWPIRAALLSALFNWPNGPNELSYLIYNGGQLLQVNRGRLAWMFEFYHRFKIDPADGYQLVLNDLNMIDLKTDMASPSNEGGGPDGQIDAHSRIDYTDEE